MSNDEMSWEEIERYQNDEMDMYSIPKRIKEHQHNIDKRINPQTGGPMTFKHKRRLEKTIANYKDRLKELDLKYGRNLLKQLEEGN